MRGSFARSTLRTRAAVGRTLSAGDEVVCFAYALQIKGDPEPVPEIPLCGRIPLGPEQGELVPRFTDYTMFGGDAVEVRFVKGAFFEPGPATAWFSLKVPVVDDRPPSPLERTPVYERLRREIDKRRGDRAHPDQKRDDADTAE